MEVKRYQRCSCFFVFCFLFFFSQIHTEFQVSLPDDVEETPEGDLSSEHFCPPTSFVAWAEPDYEDMEGTSSEPEKDSKTAGDPPESKAAELSKEEASSHKNPNEDCNSGQGLYLEFV